MKSTTNTVSQRFCGKDEQAAVSRHDSDQIVNRVMKALGDYGAAIFKELLAAA